MFGFINRQATYVFFSWLNSVLGARNSVWARTKAQGLDVDSDGWSVGNTDESFIDECKNI